MVNSYFLYIFISRLHNFFLSFCTGTKIKTSGIDSKSNVIWNEKDRLFIISFPTIDPMIISIDTKKQVILVLA